MSFIRVVLIFIILAFLGSIFAPEERKLTTDEEIQNNHRAYNERKCCSCCKYYFVGTCNMTDREISSPESTVCHHYKN